MTNYNKLNNYINFNDKLQMNEHIAQHKAAHCYQLNDTDKDLLLRISRYSVRYTGVFYQKVSTIAQALNKSESTVKRSIRKLESLGIIKRIKNIRSVVGGFGANIIQIQQCDLSQVNARKLKNNHSIHCESKHQADSIETKPIHYQSKELFNKETSTSSKESSNKSNLYNRLKSLIQARKGSLNNFKAIVGVIYSKLKKIKSDASTALTHAQLESIMYQSLDALLNKSNINNELAMLNAIINTKINDAITAVTAPIASNTNAKTELVPEWFSTRNDSNNTSNNGNTVSADTAPTVDFDKERARILAKLGY